MKHFQIHDVKEVKEATKREANKLFQEGWVLLDLLSFYDEFFQTDCIVYILGRVKDE